MKRSDVCRTTLALLVAAVLSRTVCAEPAVKAVVDLGKDDVTVKGALEFDLAGGAVRGAIEGKNLPYPADAPLRLAGGGTARGTLSATLTFSGDHPGGALGRPQGTVVLRGTFQRADDGARGTVSGEGVWEGENDAVLGTLTIHAHWTDLRYEGAGVAPSGAMSLALPTLRYGPLESLTPPSRPVAANAPSSGERAADAQPLWWRYGAVALAVIGVLWLGRRLRSARR